MEMTLPSVLLHLLTGLVADRAAGLACRLAGGLALTAAAVCSAVAEITGLQRDDMFQFHNKFLQSLYGWLYHIMRDKSRSVLRS